MNKLSVVLLVCLSLGMLSCGHSVFAEEDTTENEYEDIYKSCKENIYSTGENRDDDVFSGIEYVMPVEPRTDDYVKGSVGAVEDTNDLWLIHEYSGNNKAMQGMKWIININGEKGAYDITLPLAMEEQIVYAFIKGEFDLDTYNDSNEFLADEVSFEEGAFQRDGIIADTQELVNMLNSYPKDLVPISIDMLKYWLDNNGLGYTLSDLGIGVKDKTNTISNSQKDKKSNSSSNNYSDSRNNRTQTGTRTCPNCSGIGWVKTYETNNPWEEPTIIDCPMCRGTGVVTD